MPTLHHTLDRAGSYIRARVFLAPSSSSSGEALRPAAIAASKEARFHLTSAGVDRLRENGCYDEGDYVPPELLDELIRSGQALGARQKRTPHQDVPPMLFPEPAPPGWMLPRRRTILGL